jgi:GTP-binding protein Era
MKTPAHRTGRIAIIGRPNVGKSTLLNHMVGMKISITSNRPQTTRHRLNAIVTETDAQMVLIDTPGFQTEHGGELNRLMNRTVSQSLDGVDAVLFVIEATKFGREDRKLLPLLPKDIPVILVVNKVDKLADRAAVLPFLDEMSRVFAFAEIVPVSAAKGTQVGHLRKILKPYLPEGPPQHEEDEVTDRPERFLAAELVREKLFRLLGEELPYAATVMVEKFEMRGQMRHINIAIVVDKANHKSMVIGKGGEKLKQIGTQARIDMEKLFGGKVFLELWVQVKSGWADSPKSLKNLGYE